MTPQTCPVPAFEQRCDRLSAAFHYAASIASPFKRLVAIAQDLPRSECRKLFDVWLAEPENSKI